jgi:hypothetical protein
MRWRFVDSNNSEEAAEHAAVLKRIDAWWSEFKSQSAQIDAFYSGKVNFNIAEWTSSRLDAVHPQLTWEYGPAIHHEGHRLVISPESARYLRPLTATLLQRAPQLDRWEFYSYRQPEDVDQSYRTVEARAGQAFSDVTVIVRLGEHHRIDIQFLASGFDQGESEANHAAFVFTESLLGEQVLDEWIGVIEGKSVPKKNLLSSFLPNSGDRSSRGIPLHRFQGTVEALIGSIKEQLPNRPYFEQIDEAQWWSYSCTPDPAEDYLFEHDIIAGGTCDPDLWSASRHRGAFSSTRFSRCGERFCSLKIDSGQRVANQEVAYRVEISDELDAVLKPSGLGCSVGGATGLRYTYITLALLNLEESIPHIRSVLQRRKVPKRSWILFFDAEWIAEWVGIYDDTPPPPMPAFND